MSPIAQNVSQVVGIAPVVDIAVDQPSFQLPREIIITIAERLLDMGRANDLAVLSLLHRPLRSAIQSILWGHITVQTRDRCERLTQTLQSHGPPEYRAELAARIHSMTAVLNTRPLPGEELFIAADLIRLYALCPSLKSITLSGGRHGEHGERLYPDILHAPRLWVLTSITCLTLRGPPGHLGPFLLLHLPNLEELRLFGDMPTSHFAGHFPRSGFSLRHVVWGLASPPRPEQIRWIFSNSNEVTGGYITLNAAPASHSEWEQIRQYAGDRGMTLRSPVVGLDPVAGQT